MRILLLAAITVRITLIHNPGAGRQPAGDAAKLRKLLSDAGYELRYQSAKEDGWKRALKKPADLIVVAGGDGTVAKVTRRMVGRGVPIGVLPSGTANNISGRYLLLEAVNLPYVGPNLHLEQDSQPGDGQFDVVLVTEAERDRLLYYLEHWQDNRERLAVLPTRRGRRLQIEWTGFALHID